MEAQTPPEARPRGADPHRVPSRRARNERVARRRTCSTGLRAHSRELPPKHFYDARGAELFDRICELPEYYPTRAEREILERRAGEIARLTGRRRARRARIGHREQDARAARRPARGRHAAALRAGRRHRDRRARMRERPDRRVPRASRARRDRRLRASPRPRAAARRRQDRRVPRRHDRQTSHPAAAGASCARSRRCSAPPTTCSWGPTWSRTRPSCRRRTTTQRALRAEFNRNVPARGQPRASAPTSSPTTSSTSALFDREHEWIEMRPARAARAHHARARPRPAGSVRGGRGAAH